MKKLFLLITVSIFLISCHRSIFRSKKTEPDFDTFFDIQVEKKKSANDSMVTLQGKVVDRGTQEFLLFANIVVYKNGSLITGTQTDFDGFYTLQNIEPGIYTVEASYSGYRKNRAVNLTLKSGEKTQLNFQQKHTNTSMDMICPTGYIIPLIKMDDTTSGQTFTSEQIKRMAW